MGRGLDRAARSDRTARAVSDLEARVATFRRERKIGKGTLRAMHIATYRGYVSNGRAHIRVRVTEEPVVPDSAELITDPRVIRTNLRRFVALALPGVRLRILIGDEQVESTTDRHGYATVHIPLADARPGWHEYHVVNVPDADGEAPKIATGEFLAPTVNGLCIVSDVDDTVLRTGLTEGFVAVRQTLTRNAATRRAVPGMAELYQAIEQGRTKSHRTPAFVYLSTGPWNLYEVLTEFLELRKFPKGVLMLTDWGPQERYVMRSGKQHKRLALSRLFAALPKNRFVLIGDSGQNDPEVYVEAAREHPKSVKAIVILDVGPHMAERAAELRAESDGLSAQGIPFYLAHDAGAAANYLADQGIIARSAVEPVAQAVAREAD